MVKHLIKSLSKKDADDDNDDGNKELAMRDKSHKMHQNAKKKSVKFPVMPCLHDCRESSECCIKFMLIAVICHHHHLVFQFARFPCISYISIAICGQAEFSKLKSTPLGILHSYLSRVFLPNIAFGDLCFASDF